MTGRRAGLRAAALGCALLVAACALPKVGLFRGHLGTSRFQSYGDAVLAGRIPYRDFSLEYPPGALPALVVPSLGPGRDYDSWFMAFEAACGLACVTLVGLATRSRAAAAYCALAPLALGPLALQRFDLWVAALATAGVVALAVDRTAAGGMALAAGTAAKLYPGVLLPLALLRAPRRLRIRTCLWFAGVALLIVVPFLALGPGGIRSTVSDQMERGLQLETVASSALLALHAVGAYTPHVSFGNGSWNLSGRLPRTLGAITSALQLAAVAAVCVDYARGPRTSRRLLAAAAAAVACWAALGKVLSPQFLLWLVPLVALLGRVWPMLILLGALGLTQAVYPDRYDALVQLRTEPIVLLLARNVLLLLLAVSLAGALHRDRVLEEVGGEDERADHRGAVALDRGERDGPDRVPRVEP